MREAGIMPEHTVQYGRVPSFTYHRSIMLRSLPLSLMLGCGPACSGQAHADTWYFGNDAGVQFSNCTAFPLINGANSGFEGCATATNATDGLLFYTNSETVWDRLHSPMPNGALIPSGETLSQVLIVRQPLSASNYYLFTTRIQASGSEQLKYHVVDMTLAGGLGDVSVADVVLTTTNVTECVTATQHANGTDVWVLAHDYPSNAFRAYLLTSTGISTAPVISNAGPGYLACNSNINARGELKFSLDGTRVALTGNGVGNEPGTDLLAVFDFDPATGVVSDPMVLPVMRGEFGVSFSPDASKLYVSTWKALNFTSTDSNYVYQLDLSSGDSATIAASRWILESCTVSEPFGSVQLAPDGRVYVARALRDHLGVVDHPDAPGAGCDYTSNGLYLNGRMCRYGLNNFIQYVDCDQSTAIDVAAPPEDLSIIADPATGTILVHDADPAGIGAIRVHDATGRHVRIVPRTGSAAFHVGDLAQGTYVFQPITTAGARVPARVLVWCR